MKLPYEARNRERTTTPGAAATIGHPHGAARSSPRCGQEAVPRYDRVIPNGDDTRAYTGRRSGPSQYGDAETPRSARRNSTRSSRSREVASVEILSPTFRLT